ncbi:hypothetical protein MPSEU_000944500 [Mayamaea pseudoterrestris]|nr:hypothetical protein MPSEU_000944500 [Mayamaea pseudoterrestris]
MGSAASTSRPQQSQDSNVLHPSLLNAFSNRIVKSRCEAPPPPPPATSDDAAAAAPPPPPPSELALDSIAAAAASVSSTTISNPGPYEQAAQDAKRLVMLETFDGFRCDINKQVSPYMAAVHSFWMGTQLPDGRKSTYTFLTQVADEKGGLLMARIDLGRGSIDGRIHRALLGGLCMAKLQVSASQEGQTDQALGEVDFGGQTWTANLKYGSMGGGIMYGGNYFQAITQKLSMGGEGMYIDANQKLLSSYTLKYIMPAKTGDEEELLLGDAKLEKSAGAAGLTSDTAAGSSTVVLNYNAAQQACTMNYKRVVTPGRVTVGAELTFSPYNLKSEVLLGAEFKLQRSKYSMCLDPSNLRLQSVLEAKLGMAHGSPSLQLAADVAPWSDEMKFGYGITIDG